MDVPDISPEVRHHLNQIAATAFEIERLSGHSTKAILITQHFANVLEKEGFIPQFNYDMHERALVWWWLTFKGIRLVSRCPGL